MKTEQSNQVEKTTNIEELKEKMRRRRLGICIDANTHPVIIQMLQLMEELRPGNKKADLAVVNAIKDCPTNEYDNACEAFRIKYGLHSAQYNYIKANIDKAKNPNVKDFTKAMDMAAKTQQKQNKKKKAVKKTTELDQFVVDTVSGNTRKRFQAVETEDV